VRWLQDLYRECANPRVVQVDTASTAYGLTN